MKRTVNLELLIVVKSYPNPSQSLGEATCVVGICKERGLVRIYPVPFRKLEDEKQFKKYQLIKLEASKPKDDPRPNTFRPRLDTLEITGDFLSTSREWQQRREWVMPWLDDSMCSIQRQQQEQGKSMGIFKPAEVIDVLQEKEDADWSAGELGKLAQRDFFITKENQLLEKLPYRWSYKYRCSDPNCPGHEQTIIDWELGQLYRNLKSKGIAEIERIHRKIRLKYLTQMCGSGRDTYFFTGNMARRQKQFLVLGVFWPPIQEQGELF